MEAVPGVRGRLCLALVSTVWLAAAPEASQPARPGPAEPDRPPPGVRIERAPTGAEGEETRARLVEWRRVYRDRLAALRGSAALLFAELEGSSLATLTDRCRSLLARAAEVDRAALFPAPEVDLDRVLFGSLERYRAGAGECLAGRFLSSYRLLLEARAGLEWVDRRVDRRLEPPVPLPGLGPPR